MLLATFRVKAKGLQLTGLLTIFKKGSAIIALVLGNFRLGPAMGAK